MKKPKIFIACDTTNLNKIKRIIKETQNSKLPFGYKFGLEFLNSKNGRKFVSNLKNKTTWGDYKWSDIPNTCASAMRAVKDLKFNYITIHISAGLESLRAAKKVSGKTTKLVGVSILTSLNNKSLKEIGYNRDVKKIVSTQAKLASKAKLDAIVCSGHEIRSVKRVFNKEIITPGIKIQNTKNDQKRIMKPEDAFTAGSDWLVIGRSITKGNIKKNIQNLLETLEE